MYAARVQDSKGFEISLGDYEVSFVRKSPLLRLLGPGLQLNRAQLHPVRLNLAGIPCALLGAERHLARIKVGHLRSKQKLALRKEFLVLE